LPLERAAFAFAEKIRLIEADEPADAGSLSDGCAEVDVAGPLFFDVEDQVDVAILIGLACLRRRHVLLEEPEIRDVTIALDQPFLVEYVAR
jgi:hypothetical protein